MGRWHWPLLAIGCMLLAPVSGRTAEDPLRPNVPEHYELHKLLVDTINHVERNYVKPIDRRKLVEAAIQGVLKELDDYSDYVAPEEMTSFQTAVSQQFAGIGVQIGIERGQLKVISPLVGTPAYRAGLLAGEHILEIDGTTTKGMRLDEAIGRLKGEAGSSVVLKVSHPGREQPDEITLTREVVRIETVLGDRRNQDDRWDYLLDDEARIGYVRISGFGRNTADDLRNVLRELRKQGLAALILDLRFNPGGLLSSAIEVSDLFVPKGRIVSTEGRNVPEQVWEARRRGTFEGFPIVVLVNRYSASASEIVSACLQDHQRAIIVGERTYGKGSVQRVIEMEGGQSALKLTTAGYHRPNGKNIDRQAGAKPEDDWGVKPDDGYELRLSDSEMVALLRYRRDRDILKPMDRSNSEETPTIGVSSSGEADDDRTGSPREGFVDLQLKMALDRLRKTLAGQLAGPGSEEPGGQPSAAAELAEAREKPEEMGIPADEEPSKGAKAGKTNADSHD